MIQYPSFSPEIVRIGPFALRWYGLMYVFGFGASYLIVRSRLRSVVPSIIRGEGQKDFLSALYTYLVTGLMLGARLGYVLFYDLGQYVQRPWEVFAVWHGGMSFHGGLIGSVVAGVLCCRTYGVDAWAVADLIIGTAPIGIGLGRLGNFINGELYGRVTDVPWAMVFPEGGPLPRHPSQLYELLLEGVVLFVLLSWLRRWIRKPGILAASFLVLYGLFRILAELFRQPDAQLGFLIGQVTMGQVLSALMVLAGIILLWARAGRRPA